MPSRRAARAARSFRAAAMTACSQLCRSATDVLSAISLPPRVGRWIERLIGGRELAFDAHRVGLFVYTYEQGLSLDPPREDGRRCLDSEELQSKGWTQDGRGRWLDPVRVQAARESFAKLELACRSLAERRQGRRLGLTFPHSQRGGRRSRCLVRIGLRFNVSRISSV